MEQQIIPLELKFTTCYLIRGKEGFVMVDAGPPRCTGIFTAAMQKLSLDPGDIKMIFITHGHWDHWGSLKEIAEISGAPCAINHREVPWLKDRRVRVPRGIGLWGKSMFVLLAILKPYIRSGLKPLTADIALEDEAFRMDEYGIPGRIFHTPGHTEGSMSLLLDSGDAFVGDLAMSGFPRITGPGPFVLGQDIQAMKRSWQLLLDEGAVKIYPAHGKPFSARVFDEYYASEP